jgi:phospholipid transport system substrate-binding protein
MEKGAAGWKVYDVVVADLSLVQNYRGSFESEVRRGGIDGLVKALTDKNRQLNAGQAQAAAK